MTTVIAMIAIFAWLAVVFVILYGRQVRVKGRKGSMVNTGSGFAPQPAPRKVPVPHRLAPKHNIQVTVIPPAKGCDRCGKSRVPGSTHMPVAQARFEIKTPKGSIFLCGHHFEVHRLHITERAYETAGA